MFLAVALPLDLQHAEVTDQCFPLLKSINFCDSEILIQETITNVCA